MKSYQRESLSLAPDDVSVYFNEITFSLLEFETAFQRGDSIWATQLASHLTADLSMILAYLYHQDSSKLGAKRLHLYLPEELRKEFIEILNE